MRAWLRKREQYEHDEGIVRSILPSRDSAVAVLIFSPGGIILVKDARKIPSLWKPPGGKIKPGETQAEAAVREVWEETKVRLRPDWLRTIAEVDKRNHDLVLFRARLHATPFVRGTKYEIAKIFPLEEAAEMENIYWPYRDYIREAVVSLRRAS